MQVISSFPVYCRYNIHLQRLVHEIDQLDSYLAANDMGNQYVYQVLFNVNTNRMASTPSLQAYLGKVLLGYQLLDMLVWAYGWPQHEDLKNIPRGSHSRYGANLERVLNSLVNWTGIVSTFNSAKLLDNSLSLPSMSSNKELRPYSSVQSIVKKTDLISSKTIPDACLVSTLTNLLISNENGVKRAKYDCLEKWHAVAGVIGAFRPVS